MIGAFGPHDTRIVVGFVTKSQPVPASTHFEITLAKLRVAGSGSALRSRVS